MSYLFGQNLVHAKCGMKGDGTRIPAISQFQAEGYLLGDTRDGRTPVGPEPKSGIILRMSYKNTAPCTDLLELGQCSPNKHGAIPTALKSGVNGYGTNPEPAVLTGSDSERRNRTMPNHSPITLGH